MVCITNKSHFYINYNLDQDDDIYCKVKEVFDEGIQSELVCNNYKQIFTIIVLYLGP